jgi:aspartate/methionine/tyrosine aminotransferase
MTIARTHGTTLLLDEFYSHFNFEGDEPISGAPFIEDVDRDPVLLFDGLTKSYRYPGWRVGWVVGPPEMVETMARTASAIDGGPSRIAQRAALAALEPARADQETRALRTVFKRKRDTMVRRLEEMGVRFAAHPASTFYCWGTLRELPEPFDDAMTFFRRALERKVMTVPGAFFDVNPGGYRRDKSRYAQWMRFSFGPDMDNMNQGLDRLAEMLAEA